jgi:hypothetical protein
MADEETQIPGQLQSILFPDVILGLDPRITPSFVIFGLDPKIQRTKSAHKDFLFTGYPIKSGMTPE